jgi:hypothetical protein
MICGWQPTIVGTKVYRLGIDFRGKGVVDKKGRGFSGKGGAAILTV